MCIKYAECIFSDKRKKQVSLFGEWESVVPNRFEDFHGIDDSFTNEGTKAMVVSQKKGGYISWSNGHLCFIYIYIYYFLIYIWHVIVCRLYTLIRYIVHILQVTWLRFVSFSFIIQQRSNRHEFGNRELTKPSISGISLSDFEVSIANDHRARL